MNPVDFMQVALRLSAGDEASKRTAVSRAYYCVFHLAMQLVESCGVQFSSGSPPHENVGRCLQHAGIEQAEHVGLLLKLLRIARNAADYDLALDKFRSQDEINVNLAMARDAMTALAAVQRDAIESNVRTYAGSILRLKINP